MAVAEKWRPVQALASPGFARHRGMWVGGCEMNEVDAAAATLIERKMVNPFGTMRT